MQDTTKTQDKILTVGCEQIPSESASSASRSDVGSSVLLDTKGRPLIHLAWYALHNDDDAYAGILAQFQGPPPDEYGPIEPCFVDETDRITEVNEFDHATLQHCAAASAAGVQP